VQYTIEFGGDPRLVTITTSGPAERATFVRFREEFVSDPRFRPGMPILIDHLALDTTPLTVPDIRAIAESIARFSDRLGPSRIAIVAPDTLTFGFARMTESLANPERMRVSVFYSREEAISWLREDDRTTRRE